MKKLLLTILGLASFSAFSQTARLQAIHNSPDPIADTVNVYVNGDPFVPNLAFRNATPFVDAPAGVPLTISILPKGESDTANAVFTTSVTLTANETYVVVASGVVDATTYPTLPTFSLEIFTGAREVAASSGDVDVLIQHGSPDAPAVLVNETSVPAGNLVPSIAFPDFIPDYADFVPLDYELDVRLVSDSSLVGSYSAPLNTLGLTDSAIVVFASGFADPSNPGPGFGLFAALANGDVVQLPETTQRFARVQVIHNSPDPIADTVNVYLNGDPLIPDFAFRTATPFVDAPAETPITLSILPKGETDTANAVFSATLTLDENETYVVVASGVVDATTYPTLPTFSLEIFTGAREVAASSGDVDVLIQHGSPDAPAVLVNETSVPAGNLVPSIAFPDFIPDYADFVPLDYELDVRLVSDSSLVGSYSAPLNTLGLTDSAIVVFASGFADPSNPGPGFGLFAALANGDVVQLPETTQRFARVQIIHNSADPLADEVDIWIDTVKIAPNFAYGEATPFLDVKAEQNIVVSITAANSNDTTGSVYRTGLILDENETYVVIAAGLVDNTITPFEPLDLYIYAGAQETAMDSSETDVLVFHGATDAPTVNVDERTVPVTGLVTGISFGDFDGYLPLLTDDYELEVQLTDQTVVAVFEAPLQSAGLEGQAIVLFASGFVDETSNPDAPFFLKAALADGTVITLPLITRLSNETFSSSSEDITLYPNPTSEMLFINGLESGASVHAELIDMNGRTVDHIYNPSFHGGILEVPVSKLPSGSYFIRLNENGKVSTNRFIIQK